MDRRSDDDLVAAARAGDAAALDALLERHQGQVYRFGLKMCRDPEVARDVAQDTLIAMARGVRDFRGASSLSTWLYTIARSYCIKQHRKRAAGPASERSLDGEAAAEATQLVAPGPTPDDALAGKQVERALEAAIASLDPMYREVLVLRDVEGLTAPEVAEIVGVSVDAVKSRLHRARLAVREQVAPVLGVPAAAAAPAATCPDILLTFSRHLEDEIDHEVCARMERHLAGCPRCTAACDSLRRTLALCRTAPAAQVPVSVQEALRRAVRELAREKP